MEGFRTLAESKLDQVEGVRFRKQSMCEPQIQVSHPDKKYVGVEEDPQFHIVEVVQIRIPSFHEEHNIIRGSLHDGICKKNAVDQRDSVYSENNLPRIEMDAERGD